MWHAHLQPARRRLALRELDRRQLARGVVIGIGIAVFVAGSLLVDVPVQRAARAAPPRRALPGRVSLVAFLAATEWADFAILRDSVGL